MRRKKYYEQPLVTCAIDDRVGVMQRMAITLYGIRNCDTVKEARIWLEDHDIENEFHDYRTAARSASTKTVFVRTCARGKCLGNAHG